MPGTLQGVTVSLSAVGRRLSPAAVHFTTPELLLVALGLVLCSTVAGVDQSSLMTALPGTNVLKDAYMGHIDKVLVGSLFISKWQMT